MYGNSIRLRLSRTDVAEFGRAGSVESATDFGNGSGRLVYRLLSDEKAVQPVATFAGGEIFIRLPRDAAARWTGSDEVSVEADQHLNDRDVLKIIVEKDFACLNKRPGNDDVDAYPHPLADKLF